MEFSFLVNSQVLNEWTHTDIIDPTNAILLSLIAKYDNPHNKLEHDDDGRVWINLSYITHQIPWISLNSDSLGKRLKKLAEIGLIDRSQRKTQTGSKLYFKMSAAYREMEAWYDELHSIESSTDTQNIQSAISIHYSKKPKIAGEKDVVPVDNSTKKTVNNVSHPSQNTGAHPSQNTTDPNSINPNSKKRGEENNTCITEGEVVDNSPPSSFENSEDESSKLWYWIESKIEEDGIGHFFLHIETKRKLDRFKDLYGARWVCEELIAFRKKKEPSKLRQFFKIDFPEHLAKASKNKSPPKKPIKPLNCPVCGCVVPAGNMGSCGNCGMDVELFNNKKAVDEHIAWREEKLADSKGEEVAAQTFFSMFDEDQEKAG